MKKHSYDDIRGIWFYQYGNDFSGSEGLFNFKIIPRDNKLEVYVWYGQYCFQKSTPVAEDKFELTQSGLNQVHDFLKIEFEKFNK